MSIHISSAVTENIWTDRRSRRSALDRMNGCARGWICSRCIYIYYRERERHTLPCTTWLWKMVTWPRRREFETYARSCVGIHSFLSSGEMACWLLVNGSCWGKSFAFKLPTKKGSHDRYARFLNDLWIAFVLIAFRNWNWFSVSDFVDFFLKFYFFLFFFLIPCF